jgi:hypothetical protein
MDNVNEHIVDLVAEMAVLGHVRCPSRVYLALMHERKNREGLLIIFWR